jgi:hypothetical protein
LLDLKHLRIWYAQEDALLTMKLTWWDHSKLPDIKIPKSFIYNLDEIGDELIVNVCCGTCDLGLCKQREKHFSWAMVSW